MDAKIPKIKIVQDQSLQADVIQEKMLIALL